MPNDTALKDAAVASRSLAATPPRPRGPEVIRRAAPSADASLRRAVLAGLIADPMVKTGHIDVVASAGHVTLSGYVSSHAQKDAARAVTGRVKGVAQVADAVLVAVPCPDAIGPELRP